jgi:hypothetical protein
MILSRRHIFIASIIINILLTHDTGAQSTLVTIAEDPSQTTSSLQNSDVFNFNSLPTGYSYDVSWSGVGSFDELYISNANVWGGAVDESTGAGSQFSWQGNNWAQTSTLSLNESSSYFGLWWSAGDANNQLSFYSGDSLVAQYTTSSMFGSLNLSTDYYGNPLTGGNTREPYAFINFYGDESTSWDRIELTQTGGGGFESDNYTTRVEAFDPEVDEVADLGSVVAEVSGTETIAVDNSTTTWVWVPESSAPAAPTPPIYALILFTASFAIKDLLQKRKIRTSKRLNDPQFTPSDRTTE